MRECHFGHDVVKTSLLARPILERAAHPVRRNLDTASNFLRDLVRPILANGSSRLGTGENKVRLSARTHFLKNFDCARRQRYAMLPFALQALGRDRPNAGGLEFVPNRLNR